MPSCPTRRARALEARAADARLELLGIAALDLIGEQAIQELAMRQVVLDGLPCAQLEGLQYTRESQFLE
jgi:hypothetical protein